MGWIKRRAEESSILFGWGWWNEWWVNGGCLFFRTFLFSEKKGKKGKSCPQNNKVPIGDRNRTVCQNRGKFYPFCPSHLFEENKAKCCLFYTFVLEYFSVAPHPLPNRHIIRTQTPAKVTRKMQQKLGAKLGTNWRGFGAAMFRVLSLEVRALVVTSRVSLKCDFAPKQPRTAPLLLSFYYHSYMC